MQHSGPLTREADDMERSLRHTLLSQIQTIMRAQGMTRSTLAARAGLHPSTVGKIFNVRKEQTPSLRTLVRIVLAANSGLSVQLLPPDEEVLDDTEGT